MQRSHSDHHMLCSTQPQDQIVLLLLKERLWSSVPHKPSLLMADSVCLFLFSVKASYLDQDRTRWNNDHVGHEVLKKCFSITDHMLGVDDIMKDTQEASQQLQYFWVRHGLVNIVCSYWPSSRLLNSCSITISSSQCVAPLIPVVSHWKIWRAVTVYRHILCDHCVSWQNVQKYIKKNLCPVFFS